MLRACLFTSPLLAILFGVSRLCISTYNFFIFDNEGKTVRKGKTMYQLADEETPAGAKYCAEFVGTFVLMFTIMSNIATHSVGASISIGATLMVLVYALGSVSGGHFNPAVTFSVLLSGRRKISGVDATAYAVFQTAGALIGAVLSSSITGNIEHLQPGTHYSVSQALTLEVLYSTMLCYVVLNVATTHVHRKNQASGLAIGFTVTSSIIAIGNISGCSLNPALSIGTTLVSAFLTHEAGKHAILFCTCPLVGAVVAYFLFYLVRCGPEYQGDLYYDDDDETHRRGDDSREYNVQHQRDERPAVIAWTGAGSSSPQAPAGPSPAVVATGTKKPQDQREDKGAEKKPLLPKAPPVGKAKGKQQRGTAVQQKPALSLTSQPMQLASGQSVHLHKALESCDLFVGMRTKSKAVYEIDFACVKFDKDGKCLQAVYFADLEDADNGIKHIGSMSDATGGAEGLTPQDDDEMITFRLSKIKPHLHYLFFVATVFSSDTENTFQNIEEFNIRLVRTSKDADDRHELCSFNKTVIATGNAMVTGMLYRDADNEWRFEAIDKCYNIPEHGTYRALEPQLMRLCKQKREVEGGR